VTNSGASLFQYKAVRGTHTASKQIGCERVGEKKMNALARKLGRPVIIEYGKHYPWGIRSLLRCQINRPGCVLVKDGQVEPIVSHKLTRVWSVGDGLDPEAEATQDAIADLDCGGIVRQKKGR
jgi:hypothetical protein